LVYCSQCGSYNDETADNCSNCGASLMVMGKKPAVKHEYHASRGSDRGQHSSSSSIGLLIGGLILIVIGLAVITEFTMFWSYFWPTLMIIIGLWLLILWYRRNIKRNRF